MKNMPTHHIIALSTSSALPRAVRMAICIFFVKQMPELAMRLTSIFGTLGFATQGVDTRSYVLHVNRIHALRSAAKMVSLSIISDFMNKHAKANAVSTALVAPKRNSRIARFESSADPKPARSSPVGNPRMDQDSTKKVSEKFLIYRNAVRIVLNHLGLQLGLDGLRFRGLTHREASLILA